MKILKIFGILAVIFLALLGFGIYWGKNWVYQNLESVINAKPDRKYDFTFDKVEFSLLQKVILISEVKITPVGEQKGVFVEGKVAQVFLNKFSLYQLFMEKDIQIRELMFSQPEFVIHIPLENPEEEKAGEAMKSLFGDILSRGGIENFELGQASAVILLGEEKIGSFSDFNLVANDLRTDSLKWSYPIPFDYGRIFMSMDSLDYRLPNGQQLKAGKIIFDTNTQQFKMNDLSLKYIAGIREASKKMEFQNDLIDFELDSLVFSGLEANSNLYSDLDVRARKLEVAGLILEDYRNKDLPRPKDEIKPLFQGMVKKISVPLKLDTLRITNGAIAYGESVPGKNDYWNLHIDHLNGDIVNITTIDAYQKSFEHFDGNFTGKVEGSGTLKINLKVPYDKDEFDMEVDFTNFPMPKVNEILKPIMNGDIVTGDLVKMNLKIHGDPKKSTNTFRFDYTNLKMELFKKGEQKKNRFLSSVANVALNTSNLPGEKKYLTANYTVARNPNRGPFYLLWQSTKEGMMKIVPGGAVKEILSGQEK